MKFIKFERGRSDQEYQKPIISILYFALLFGAVLAYSAYGSYLTLGFNNLSFFAFIVLLATFAIYIVFAICYSRFKWSKTNKRYVGLGVAQVYLGLFFFLAFVIFSWFFDAEYSLIPYLILGTVALTIIKLLFTRHMLIKDLYRTKKSSLPSNIVPIFFMPIVLFAPRLLGEYFSYNVIWNMMILGGSWLISYCLWGSLNFLKCYYMNKYNISLGEIDGVK